MLCMADGSDVLVSRALAFDGFLSSASFLLLASVMQPKRTTAKREACITFTFTTMDVSMGCLSFFSVREYSNFEPLDQDPKDLILLLKLYTFLRTSYKVTTNGLD